MTIFNTPILTPFLRLLSTLFLYFKGWTSHATLPPYDKYVVVGAPHTSNWDMLYFLTFMLKHRIILSWMGKDSLFRSWYRPVMIWLGGIPVSRHSGNGLNQVDQVAAIFQQRDKSVVIIAPEGTRAKGARWKSGFYHIAQKAKVPLLLGYLDHSTRNIGYGPVFHPTGNYEKDLEDIQAFYRGKTGQLYGFEESTNTGTD